MKKVIFICLLSLSMCLSAPSEQLTTQQVPKIPAAVPNAQNPATSDSAHTAEATKPTEHPAAGHEAAVPAVNIPTKPADQTTNNTLPKENQAVPTATETNASVNDTNKTVPEKKETTPKKDDTTKDKDGKKVVPPKDDKATSEKPVPATATTPANNEKITSSTVKPEITTKPTETPKEGDKPTLQARGFDGPSFIGGIILTLGLLAIGFMGFKYYKNQTERNYHTL